MVLRTLTASLDTELGDGRNIKLLGCVIYLLITVRIFIIEGAVTAAVGLIAVYFIPDWPEQNRRLTPDEKELLRRRMELDELRDMGKLDHTALRMILSDWKIWLRYG
jgi:hypothetical protein